MMLVSTCCKYDFICVICGSKHRGLSTIYERQLTHHGRLDLSLPLNGSIDRSSPSWSTNLLNEYIETIDAFKNYENVLGYNVGNEVINLASNTNAARASIVPFSLKFD